MIDSTHSGRKRLCRAAENMPARSSLAATLLGIRSLSVALPASGQRRYSVTLRRRYREERRNATAYFKGGGALVEGGAAFAAGGGAASDPGGGAVTFPLLVNHAAALRPPAINKKTKTTS